MKISKIYLDLWREGFRIRRMIYLYILKIEGLLIYMGEEEIVLDYKRRVHDSEKMRAFKESRRMNRRKIPLLPPL